MKEVIRINLGEQQQEEKPVEFKYFLSPLHGWFFTETKASEFSKIVYLGKCPIEGDMFADYRNEKINIYRGYLNSGKY